MDIKCPWNLIWKWQRHHAWDHYSNIRSLTLIWFVVVIAKLFFYVESSKETNDIVVLGVKGNFYKISVDITFVRMSYFAKNTH